MVRSLVVGGFATNDFSLLMGLFGNWGEKRKRAICQISTLTMIISSSLPSQKIPRPKNFDCGNSCRVLQLIFRRNPFIHPSTSVIISRADRKSQVRQCLGFCTADFCSLLAYESAEQKTQKLPNLRLHIRGPFRSILDPKNGHSQCL